ncbi:MAG: hypothetical protein FWD23_02070 [Oscillospiraceae bacterium]|nr:hypothetical protein [Oscillospiraceae bacterium]
MTKRERYLAAMRRDPTDGELVWAPNFDYWLAVNGAGATLPEAYVNKSRNDIVRAIGASIWNRAGALLTSQDPKIKHTSGKRPNGASYHEITTPVGTVYEEFMPSESKHSSYAHTKHFITDRQSLRVMTYIAQGTDYSVDFENARKALKETGDDGIVLHQLLCVPLIQFAKTDAGYMNAFYLMEDYPEDVGCLLSVYHKKYVEAFKMLAGTTADVIEFGDNMDEVMISPKLFKRYAVGFYQECKSALKGSGKILAAHWCGRTQHLLPLLPETGIEVVEAVVTSPMADISLKNALEALDGKVALQGGIPAVMVCADVISPAEFENYIESTILALKGMPGFILGMSDNVPPNADFSRVEMIAKLIS